MINIIIIDDEQHAIDAFTEVVSEYTDAISTLDTFSNPEHFLQNVHQYENLDILFLDIEMVPYSGFQLLNLLLEKYNKQLPFDVIFVTAYHQYAVQAFNYNALDYLLKPLMKDDFERVIQKWQEKENKFLHKDQWEQLKYLLNNNESVPDRIAIPNIEGYTLLPFDHIVRCEADRNYTHIIDKELKKHTVCRTLKEVEHLLERQGFLRVHHSHIINPKYVQRVLKESGGTLEMTDDSRIIITKNKEQNMETLFRTIRKL